MSTHPYDGTANDGFCHCGKPVYDPIHTRDPYPSSYDPHAVLVNALETIRRCLQLPPDAQVEVLVLETTAEGARSRAVFRRTTPEGAAALLAVGEPADCLSTGPVTWVERLRVSQRAYVKPCAQAAEAAIR